MIWCSSVYSPETGKRHLGDFAEASPPDRLTAPLIALLPFLSSGLE
jgi:hypothetical protein